MKGLTEGKKEREKGKQPKTTKTKTQSEKAKVELPEYTYLDYLIKEQEKAAREGNEDYLEMITETIADHKREQVKATKREMKKETGSG
jgi:hypothetical protein